MVIRDPEVAQPSRLRNRVGFGVLSQVISSGGNVIITFVGARYLSPSDFGAYATGVLVALVVHSLIRSFVTEPALVALDDPVDDPRSVGQAVLATVLVGSVMVGVAGIGLGGVLGSVLVAFACVLPAMALHDAGRYIAFAIHEPRRAVVLDMVWTGIQMVAVIVVVSRGLTPVTLAVAWGASASVSAIMVVVDLGIRRPSLTWVRRSWHLSWRFAMEWVSWAGAAQVAQVGLGAVAGLPAVGGFRATQVLFGPLNVLYMGAIAVIMPEGRRVELTKFLRGLVLMSAVLAAVALSATFVGLVIPDAWAQEIFGDTWRLARRLMLPAGIIAALSAVNSGAIAGLRSMLAVQASLSTRLKLSPGVVVLPLVAAAKWGAEGFAWALAGWMIVSTIAWWHTYLRVYRQRRADGDVVDVQ